MQAQYDRLHGVKTEEVTFDFLCPICNKNGIKDKELIEINPINISYRPVGVDNSDLPKNLRGYYDSLPVKRDAILQSIYEDGPSYVIWSCRDCGSFNIKNIPINKSLLKKWLDAHYPAVLDLSIRAKV